MSGSGEVEAVPVVVPQFGTQEGEVVFVGWLVENGEQVMVGERVAELLVPGVLVQLAAPASGQLHHGSVSADAVVHVGQTLAEVIPDPGDVAD